MIKIAVDAMGGDFGPEPIVNGVLNALKEKDFYAYLVGDAALIKPLIKNNDKVTILDTKEVIKMQDGATNAFKKKETSIYKAIDLVKNNECDALVSAGHSGATMSLATLKIGRLKGVLRPAIATFMPTYNNSKTLVLDMGANVDCKAEHLFQFGIMGEIYAREVSKIPNPKVGLLSNGEEESKGDELSKETFKLLSRLDSFVGNVEGGSIFDGSVDVVVCDGFVGNIVLKTTEGAAVAMSKFIKNEVKSSPLSMLGAFLMKKSFANIKKKTDYDEYGGAPLLGVQKCVIISHGKSSPKAIKNAIFQALRFTKSDIRQDTVEALEKFKTAKG